MNEYTCPYCGEEWEVQEFNGLLPGTRWNDIDAWYLDEGQYDNCPACCEDHVVGSWIWVTPRDAYFTNVVLAGQIKNRHSGGG